MSLSTAFPCTKIPRPLGPRSCKPAAGSPTAASASALPAAEAGKQSAATAAASRWCVYLIASCRLPRTYVGVTTDFPRRLRQHNGELKGGAKAASAGRPWNLACLVEGFVDKSEVEDRRPPTWRSETYSDVNLEILNIVEISYPCEFESKMEEYLPENGTQKERTWYELSFAAQRSSLEQTENIF